MCYIDQVKKIDTHKVTNFHQTLRKSCKEMNYWFPIHKHLWGMCFHKHIHMELNTMHFVHMKSG
jgi:hypothetical protein